MQSADNVTVIMGSDDEPMKHDGGVNQESSE